VTSIDAASLLLCFLGILAPVVARSGGSGWRSGLGCLLDLWMAAGLLRLAGAPAWDRIAAAASIVAVRKMVVAALSTRRHRSRGERFLT
jgi:hypothetical protein